MLLCYFRKLVSVLHVHFTHTCSVYKYTSTSKLLSFLFECAISCFFFQFSEPYSCQFILKNLHLTVIYKLIFKSVYLFCFFRGQSGNAGSVAFRRWYNNIQELRSLLPSQTPFIALTATAMKKTREKICTALNMTKPNFVMVSPERPNISYRVIKMSNKVHVTEYFDWLFQVIKSKGKHSERCIIYCQTVNQCSTLFSLFSVCLGSKIYLNEQNPNPKERLVEMMHARTPENVKETVLTSMATYDGHLRVLICTIAFGMGVDAKGVRTIINFGPSRNLESYVQESGRCSRDGQPGTCIILYLGRMLSTCSQDIKDYVSSEKCRRELINSYFDQTNNAQNTTKPSGHECCDNCATTCTCGGDVCSFAPVCTVTQSSPERSPVRNVSDEQISSLRRGLVAYKKKWIVFCMKSNSQCKNQVSAISYPSFLLEFGGYHIEQVIDNVAFIKSFNDIMNYIEIWRLCHAIEIWKLMKGLFADLVDETLPDAPVEDTDVSEDNCDDDDWERLLNESLNDFSLTTLLEDESMDIDEDVEHGYPDIVDNVLNTI